MGMKGTPSMGKKGRSKTHVRCRRCGRHSYNLAKRYCAHCGFGRSKKLRNYNWSAKKVNRKRKPNK
ncbi:50S ribosomal protein L37e [Nanoarchaeota archaeon]|nr:50S ribosomal protein L37e [Nanoarchaeota archaeon]RLG17362.1 MAG: 50S ribosomal protein L37e [Nanoarchaeota archaeon]